MKITVQEAQDATTLKLEGKVVGPWGNEFERAWKSLEESLGSRKLIVDLCGVTQMDLASRKLLAKIHLKTAAKFLANTPMIEYFVEQARRSLRDQREEQ